MMMKEERSTVASYTGRVAGGGTLSLPTSNMPMVPAITVATV